MDYEESRRNEVEKVWWAAGIMLLLVALGIYYMMKSSADNLLPHIDEHSALDEER